MILLSFRFELAGLPVYFGWGGILFGRGVWRNWGRFFVWYESHVMTIFGAVVESPYIHGMGNSALAAIRAVLGGPIFLLGGGGR